MKSKKSDLLKKVKKHFKAMGFDVDFENDTSLSIMDDKVGIYCFIVNSPSVPKTLSLSFSAHFSDSMTAAFVALECSKLAETELYDQFFIRPDDGKLVFGDEALKEFSKIMADDTTGFSDIESPSKLVH